MKRILVFAAVAFAALLAVSCGSGEFTDAEKLRADVNADGKVNIKDATAIQKFVAKIETGFLIGEKIA